MSKSGNKQESKFMGRLLKNSLVAAVAVAAAATLPELLSKQFPQLTSPVAANKPYNSFEAFFPFYMTQHADETCRRLHFVGTSLVALFALADFGVITAFLTAGAVGLSIQAVTFALPHGLVEMAAMLLTFILTLRAVAFTRFGRRAALLIPICGYSFAWVGHFFFEKNKPATFVYPTYSLLGDFRLFYEILSGQRAF